MSDHDTIVAAQTQMQEAVLELEQASNDIAKAKTVKEFSSDQRKIMLATCVKFYLDAGEGLGAAEHKARASDAFAEALGKRMAEYQVACETIEAAEALKLKFASAQSILSAEKAKIGLI